MVENKIDYKSYVEVYDKLVELNILKRCIKENVQIDKNGDIKPSLFFGEELLNLIKYIDKEFYNELQQRVDK